MCLKHLSIGIVFLTFVFHINANLFDMVTDACPENQYYDATVFRCVECPQNSYQDSTGTECICNNGFYIANGTPFHFQVECEPCGEGESSTQDRLECLPCQEPAIYNQDLKTCQCEQSFRLIDHDIYGAQLVNITCEQCPDGQFQNPDNKWQCISCPHPKMTIPDCQCQDGWSKQADSCVYQEDLQELSSSGFSLDSSITYNSVVIQNDGEKREIAQRSIEKSGVFEYYFNYAAVGCWKEQNPQKCQILANLCVLQLYNVKTTACRFYKYLLENTSEQASSFYDDAGWVQGLPWLYYQGESDARDIITKPERVGLTVSFVEDEEDPSRFSQLKFYLARYSLDGTFEGFQEMKSELSVCKMSHDDVVNMRQFGTTTLHECEFNLHDLIEEEQLPQIANVFFDLFLEDVNGELIDIPILLKNLIDRNGEQPNTDNHVTENSQFVRRFFMYDTISGIETKESFIQNHVATYVRWANQVQFKITLDPEMNERIHVPYVVLSYREIATNAISQTSTSKVEFIVDYYQEMDTFWQRQLIAFIVFQILIVGIVILRSVFFVQSNQPSMLKQRFGKVFGLRFIYNLLDVWSEIMFWILFFTSMYIFIGFKLQKNAYTLLPSIDDMQYSYRIFYIIFGMVLGFKFLVILIKVIEQSKVDLFLIDWEGNEKMKSIVAWRSIFVANELNELQTEQRYLRPETTLIWFAFFIKGLGWEYLGQADPRMSAAPNDQQPMNLILSFFLAAFVLICIGIVQYIIEILNSVLFSLKYQEFMDFCAVCNISVIMMDQYYHGYYIHGEAPWKQSDLVASQLKKVLDDEGEGKTSNRGLEDNDPSGISTYEIYFPQDVREQYDRIFRSKLDIKKLSQQQKQNAKNKKAGKKQKNVNEMKKEGSPNEKQSLKGKTKNGQSKEVNVNSEKERLITEMEEKRKELSQILKKCIDSIKQNKNKYIYKRSACERLFSKVPSGINLAQSKETPFLVKDSFSRWPSFAKMLYCHLDYDLLILYILLFTLFFRLTDSSILAITLIYVIEKILEYIRAEVGQGNLASKTLTDSRFLIR